MHWEIIQLSLTQDQAIARFREKHGNKYDYSKVIYRGVFSKVTIICPEHGEFTQGASNHWRGQGCLYCGRVKNGDSNRKSKNVFIEEARRIHGNKYDYSGVDYIRNNVSVKIFCFRHGVFEQAPLNHLLGQGCPECGILATAEGHRLSQKDFIDLAKKKNEKLGREYDYSFVNYVRNTVKVKIRCLKHGIFEQTPVSHLQSTGCPKCGKGQKSTEDGIWLDSGWEVKVWNWCKNNNVTILRGKENGGSLFYTRGGKKHYTDIDFIINDRLVEVKGDDLLLGILGDADMMKEKLKVYKEHNILVICENIKLLPEGVTGMSIRCFD
jgi:hypothetical protein